MRETLKSVLWALAIVLVIRTAAFGAYYIPSESMVPTLQVHDLLLAWKWPYGYSRYSVPFSPPLGEGRIFGDLPERGDVVVFRHPRRDEDYIKRVVGLPGDTVQMRDGRLYINDELVPREFAGEHIYVEYGSGRPVTTRKYVETLPGGVSHVVIERSDQHGLDNTPAYAVPEGHIFVLGDNRDNSGDSRVADVGFVPLDNLIGRADFILGSAFDCDRNPQAGCVAGLPLGRFFNLIR